MFAARMLLALWEEFGPCESGIQMTWSLVQLVSTPTLPPTLPTFTHAFCIPLLFGGRFITVQPIYYFLFLAYISTYFF